MKNNATLVVDATNLYKIVFEGVKSYALQKQNIHAVWGFIKKLRGILNENINNHTYQINKTVLFWDGSESGKLRRELYPQYKEKRKRYFNGIDPYYNQIDYLKELMTLLGIVSYQHQFVETDDCIAEYIRQNKDKENILILSNDHDYFQLIDKNVYVYYMNRIKTNEHIYPKNLLINSENFEYYFDYNHRNILLRKIIMGDESDNIVGANGFSEKSIIKEIPMFVRREYDRKGLLEYCYVQREKNKNGKRLGSLISFLEDDEKFLLTESLINLKSSTFVTSDCKDDIANIKFIKIDKKAFINRIKGSDLYKQIVTDLDYDGDLNFFIQPYFLTNKI